jgi:hypothetical protein
VLVQLSEDESVVNDFKLVSFNDKFIRSISKYSFSVGLPALQLGIAGSRPCLLHVHDDESGGTSTTD